MDRTQKLIIAGLAGLALIVFCAVGTTIFFIARQQATPAQAIQPAQIAEPIQDKVPLFEFEGEGDDVFSYEAPVDGAYVFGFSHHGERNFFVKLVRSNDANILVAARGEYTGKKTDNLIKGNYLIEVTADGPWIVVISPL